VDAKVERLAYTSVHDRALPPGTDEEARHLVERPLRGRKSDALHIVTGLPGVTVLLRVDESTYDPVRQYFKERGVWTAEHQKHTDALLARQKVLADAWKTFNAKAPSDEKEFATGWQKARADALKTANMDVVLDSW